MSLFSIACLIGFLGVGITALNEILEPPRNQKLNRIGWSLLCIGFGTAITIANIF